MFLSNSRIEKNNKILFYEQDILIDDYVYNGDINISVDFEYVNPGIGITLIDNEGLSIQDNDAFLFKINNNEYNIIKRCGAKRFIVANGPLLNIKPYKENINLRLEKRKNYVKFYVNNKLMADEYITSDLDNYIIGYYSNAGNYIKSINIDSETPNEWNINMENTNGGHIYFNKNSFDISNCIDKAEIEQVEIDLKKNTDNNPYYYLKYDISKNSDIKPYVFLSNDNRYNDEEKNILLSGNKFKLKTDEKISIKFTGTKGTIKNIQLSIDNDDFYIETEENGRVSQGSEILIKTKDINKIEWTGIIYNTPKIKFTEGIKEYCIIQDNKALYYPELYNVEANSEYSYEVLVNENKMIIYNNKKIVINTINLDISDYVIIFKNMDAIISKMIIYKNDGSHKNIILENTKKEYIPAVVNGPVIVTNEKGAPLDISSSYRVFEKNGKINYRFTNIEREIFDSNNVITLSNVPSQDVDSIIIYGIKKDSNINKEKILYSLEYDINDISMFCDNFDIITEESLYYIDKKNKKIIISNDDKFVSSYKYLIVDYLKKDSYAINYVHELGCYEIDISTDENTKIYYDGVSNDETFMDIQKYKILDMNIKNNSYLVLRAGE